MVIPTFEPSNAGAQLQQQTLGMAEGFQNLFMRAEAMKQSRVRLDMEKQRFATEAAMSAVDLRRKENDLIKQNNSMENESLRVEAERKILESQKRLAQDAITKSETNERRIAELPQRLATLQNFLVKNGNDPVALARARESFQNSYGDLKDDPRVQQLVNPVLENFSMSESNATMSIDREVVDVQDDLEAAVAAGDEAKVAQLKRDPRIMAARRFNTPRGQKIEEMLTSLNKTKGELKAKADAQSDVAYATAQAAAMFKGGKPMPESQLQQMQKYLSVSKQLQVIKQTYDKDDTIFKGPIMGVFSKYNPLDVDATVLAAQLNAVVPNLARGVFGEVGVLTDQDIKQYQKLLPQYTTPEQASKVLFKFLTNLLEESYKDKMNTLSGQGYTTAGFPTSLSGGGTPADGSAAQRIAQGIGP